jgi:hypothetical protein
MKEALWLALATCLTTTGLVRAATEEVPATTGPAPVTTLPAPVVTVPGPAATQPAPVATVPGPPATQPAPVTIRPAPSDGLLPPPSVEAAAPNGGRCYGSADYLLWWTKDVPLPPLATTGSPNDFLPGVLGQPHTRILFGGVPVETEEQSGGRFTVGYWLDCDHTCGVEGTFFFLGNRTIPFRATSGQFGVLGRPFIDVTSGGPFGEVSFFPGLATGTFSVNNSSGLLGAEANGRKKICCYTCPCNPCCDPCQPCEPCRPWGYRVDVLAGFRYLHLREKLGITESLQVNPTEMIFPQFAGDRIQVFDRFETRNNFYGGQVGLNGHFFKGPWCVDLLAKVALGDNNEEVNINGGQTIITPAGVTSTFVGGLLALPSNIGSHRHDEFAVVPEVQVNAGYQVCDHLCVRAGYSFLYWSRVARPGDQIDLVLNPAQIPNFGVPGNPNNPARPAVLFRQTDFWAQGVNLGLEVRW